jgi:catechol 2,3-dioxygenase-like lactoylglutathione lyase family enzyme
MGVKALGVNHVAFEVDDVDAALEWWGRFFDFELRGRQPGMAFIDLGDQFIALSEGKSQPPDTSRHIGLVVDDKEALRQALLDAGVEVPAGRGLRVRDPSGNQLEIVDYRDVQFTKTPAALRALGVEHLEKTERAKAELAAKGIV